MNKRLIQIDLIMNLVMIVTICLAVGWYFVGPEDLLGSHGVMCFMYFTTDSNILLAISSAVWSIYLVRVLKSGDVQSIPKGALILKHVGTAAASQTFFLVLAFLAPMTGLQAGVRGALLYFTGNVFVLHFSAPLLGIISYALPIDRRKIGIRELLPAFLPVLIYGVVYLVMVVIVKKWQDFYGFTFGGNMKVVPYVFVGVLVFYFVVVMILNLLRRFSIKKSFMKKKN